MKVTAVLIGSYRAFLPPGARQEGRVTLVFDGSETDLVHVLAALGMPADTPRIVFLDGEPITDEQVLRDGQTVTFVSPLGGG